MESDQIFILPFSILFLFPSHPFSVCMYACLPACLLVCLSAPHISFSLSPCMPSSVFVCLPLRLSVCLPAYLPTYMLVYPFCLCPPPLSPYMPLSFLFVCFCIYLSVCLPAYLPAYMLFICLLFACLLPLPPLSLSSRKSPFKSATICTLAIIHLSVCLSLPQRKSSQIRYPLYIGNSSPVCLYLYLSPSPSPPQKITSLNQRRFGNQSQSTAIVPSLRFDRCNLQ